MILGLWYGLGLAGFIELLNSLALPVDLLARFENLPVDLAQVARSHRRTTPLLDQICTALCTARSILLTSRFSGVRD
jgi:hypothetical protein